MRKTNTPATMWVTAVVLVLIAGGVWLWPGSQSSASHAALRLLDTHGYAATVLKGKPTIQPVAPHESMPGLMLPLASAVLAAASALIALFYPAGQVGLGLAAVTRKLVHPLRLLQSGKIGDYVTWFVVGIAGYGVAMLVYR